jgi:hypothetical protein
MEEKFPDVLKQVESVLGEAHRVLISTFGQNNRSFADWYTETWFVLDGFIAVTNFGNCIKLSTRSFVKNTEMVTWVVCGDPPDGILAVEPEKAAQLALDYMRSHGKIIPSKAEYLKRLD